MCNLHSWDLDRMPFSNCRFSLYEISVSLIFSFMERLIIIFCTASLGIFYVLKQNVNDYINEHMKNKSMTKEFLTNEQLMMLWEELKSFYLYLRKNLVYVWFTLGFSIKRTSLQNVLFYGERATTIYQISREIKLQLKIKHFLI